MAFRSSRHWKWMTQSLKSSTAYSTATSPKMQSYTLRADDTWLLPTDQERWAVRFRSAFFPVYLSLGLIILQTSLGLLTATHHLAYNPSVRVKKKLRETIPELFFPEKVMDEAMKFIKKSFYRKVAHVQEFESGIQYLHPSPRTDILDQPPRAETLKSVGVDPQKT